MKSVFTLCLVLFLFACSSPAGRTVNTLGDKVKKCCHSFSIDKTPNLINAALPDDSAELPASSFSILERSTLMLTW